MLRTSGSVAVVLSLSVFLAGGESEQGDYGSRRYLKRDPDGWREVRRSPRGETLSRRRAPAPDAPPEVATSGLFEPYVALPTGSWPEAVAIGDLNGDGRNDVALVTSYYFDPANDHTLHVFLQTSNGALAVPAVKYPLTTGAASVDIADVNGDDRLDVVVGRGTSIGVLLQNAGGTLDPVVPYATPNAYSVKTGDFNGDGRSDVAGINWGTTEVAVLLQSISGTLASPVIYQAAHGGYDELERGDVNGDGRDDLVVMSGQGLLPNLNVLLQTPGGGFSTAVPYSILANELTSGAGVGDVTGDGRQDVVVSYGGNSPSSFVGVFRQNAGGTLDAALDTASYDIPEAVEVADVNFDGRGDVVVLHGGWEAMGIYLQDAGGALAGETLDPIPYASHYNPQGLAIGDINGDGAPDVVIADYNHGLVVLYHKPVAPGYFTVKPCRVLDTRRPASLYGGPAFASGSARTFQISGRCGIPPAAFAVALNVAVTEPTEAGHLRFYPGGAPVPNVATLNYGGAQTRSNNTLAALSQDGKLTVRCVQGSGTAHVVVDVNGYFTGP